MDVSATIAREPPSSARLQRWVAEVRARQTPSQRAAMDRWGNTMQVDGADQHMFRAGQLDVATLAALARRHQRTPRDLVPMSEHAVHIADVYATAADRPAVASALVWSWLGASEPLVASNLVHAIRDRAGLPGLRRRLEIADAPTTVDVAWFDDLQHEDAATWFEDVPAPVAPTLAEVIAAVEGQRAAASTAIADVVPFVQRTASFLVMLSARALDPLGFELSRDVRLVVDPPVAQRLEIAAWARTVQRAPCLRGQMAVMSLAVAAPWPLTLEVIACELGRGASGAFGLMLRMRGEVALPPGPQAPVLLCLPGEPIEERGARFERWARGAYVSAVEAWRAWC